MAALFTVACAALVDPAGTAQAQATTPECKTTPGAASLSAVPWAQSYLHFDRVWNTTRGRDTTGRPVTVAVVDSGFSAAFPGQAPTGQMALFADQVLPGTNTVGRGEPSDYVADCGGPDDERGHGTSVAALIAAPQGPYAFVGVAPDARILPIKAAPDGDAAIEPDAVVRGIRYAVDHGADVVNISIDFPDRGGGTAQYPQLAAAVRYAAAHDVVVVAAAGNINANGEKSGPEAQDVARYPAAFADEKWATNVISVGAIGPGGDVPDWSVTQSATTVVAPGQNVAALQSTGGYVTVSGTSFAAPLVAGVVALMRAAHPDWTAPVIRRQLEYTAQGARGTVPDPAYGYGTVDPILAVTAPLRSAPPSRPAAQDTGLPAPRAAAEVDRGREHLALGLTVGMLGLAGLAAISAGVWRSTRTRSRVA
jgi:subtilisin family serine protease